MMAALSQLKPSKWPLRMRSPMGDGARRGLDAPGASVFARRARRDIPTAGVLGGASGRWLVSVPLLAPFVLRFESCGWTRVSMQARREESEKERQDALCPWFRRARDVSAGLQLCPADCLAQRQVTEGSAHCRPMPYWRDGFGGLASGQHQRPRRLQTVQ